MEKSYHGLITALGLGPKEHVAVVGGGGKSTLCFALAEALSLNGARVISTTTTKVRQAEANAFPRLVLTASGGPGPEAIKKGLDEACNVFVGREFLQNGKVDGISSTLADDLFRMPGVEYVIIEADGAAGRPLKAPAAHEPVIPDSVTTVIALMGLKALGKPLGPDMVFRPALFKALTGLEDGDILNPEGLAGAFDGRMGLFKNTPVSARRMVFLNQLDVLPDDRSARDLARHLISTQSSVERVVLGSFRSGEFIAILSERCP
ncbi:MAG: putative selenium-dependent hydroxylase accessory protein YqeC [Deltaproteobacteria bacterium]|nr:putative selenium-dependent hydroxylase accessory protein YqeC [Deltaproteobacteria bacterium]